MKKLTKFALMLLFGAFALGFTSCSDDDDNTTADATQLDVTSSSSTLSNIVTNYVDNVVNPTYADLHNAAVELHTACAALNAKRQAGNVEQSDIDACCDAFNKARRFWEQSEAFLYGAATNDELDPHMDSWPLDQTQLANALTSPSVIAGINGQGGMSGAQFVYQNNGDFDSTLGFHGLEFILFRNGQNRLASEFNQEKELANGLNTKGDNLAQNQAKLQAVSNKDEAAFADAVSQDIQNITALLEYEWTGSNDLQTYLTNNAQWVLNGSAHNGKTSTGSTYDEAVTTVGGTNSLFATWPLNLHNIFVGGCSNISQEVYTQKLAQAYRVAIGRPEVGEEGADAADYIESPYSHRSFQDYQDNIYSIRNTLYGTRGASENNETVSPAQNSLMTYLQQNNPTLYNNLNNALNNALNTLQKAKTSGKAFVDAPGDQQAADCIAAVQALDDELNVVGTWCSRHISVN